MYAMVAAQQALSCGYPPAPHRTTVTIASMISRIRAFTARVLIPLSAFMLALATNTPFSGSGTIADPGVPNITGAASAPANAPAPTSVIAGPATAGPVGAADLSASTGPTGARQPSWVSPVAGAFRVVGPYRAPPTPYASGHRGIDLPAPASALLVAPASGVVTFRGTVVDRGTLSIRVDDRTVLSLEPVVSELSVGDRVMFGDPIGSLGTGGHCDGECVHLGVRVEDSYVNPLRYLLGKPTLLPWKE